MHKYWHTGLKRFEYNFCKIREGTACKSHSHTSHTSARNLTSVISIGRNVRWKTQGNPKEIENLDFIFSHNYNNHNYIRIH